MIHQQIHRKDQPNLAQRKQQLSRSRLEIRRIIGMCVRVALDPHQLDLPSQDYVHLRWWDGLKFKLFNCDTFMSCERASSCGWFCFCFWLFGWPDEVSTIVEKKRGREKGVTWAAIDEPKPKERERIDESSVRRLPALCRCLCEFFSSHPSAVRVRLVSQKF